MLPEKYRKPPQPVPLFNATKSTIVEDIKTRCEVTRALLDKLVADVSVEQATFHNVLLLIERDYNLRRSSLSPGFYRRVSSDSELRQAAAQAQKMRQNFDIECSMREDIFRLVDAVYNKKETLDPESQRLLEETRRDYIRSGLALPPGPARDRYKAIKERLSEIRTNYQKNIDENTGGIWFTLEEIDGLPQDVIEGLERGTDDNIEKLRVTFKPTDYLPLMRFAQNSETRKRAYIARQNRCNENIPLFREAIGLRNEAALLLGYANHAAKMLEVKMAKDVETVMKFLDNLSAHASRHVGEEVEKLLAIKKADLSARAIPFDGNIYDWDVSFYTRIQKEQNYNIDPLKVAEYFPLHTTIFGMLRLFGHLFGLVFIEIKDEEDRRSVSPTGKTEDILWDESVVLYSVWDDDTQGTSNDFVGYLYLDLHPRPGKYGHACCDLIRPGFLNPDGTRCYPATCLIANLTKPTSSKPSLLKHREVITLFHELGHGIHNLVSRTAYSTFHGIAVVQDFVEAPSQMLENWCWIPSYLRSFSSHYETGNLIPEDMVKALVDAKHVNDALGMIDQLGYAIFDMTIHTQPVHEKEMDYPRLFNSIDAKLTDIMGPEALGMPADWGHGYACSGILLSGYDAGYYGYLWSEVYSMDMFYSAFKEDPMNKEAGRRYRHMVLEKGAAQDEMLTLENFLGRKPSVEAFYWELGWGYDTPA